MATNENGLSIIELLVALAIGGVVVVTTLLVVNSALIYTKRFETRHDLAMDFLMLSEYFSRAVPNAGGWGLPVAASVYVENNCSARDHFPECQQSDRLSVVAAKRASTCRIASGMGLNLTAAVQAGKCCLEDADIASSHIMLVKSGSYSQRFVEQVNIDSCSLQTVTGPLRGNDHATTGFDWTDAEVIPIDIDTYYMDPNSFELVRFTYESGSTVNAGAGSTLADRIVDFQVALGYDFDPADGICVDNQNNTDEWLYNSQSGVEAMGVGKLQGVTPDLLRMVSIGFVIGAPHPHQGHQRTARALNGPERSHKNWVLHSGTSKFALRSTYLFQ